MSTEQQKPVTIENKTVHEVSEYVTYLEEKVKNQKKELNALHKKIRKLQWEADYHKNAAEMAKRALHDDTCKQLAKFLEERIN